MDERALLETYDRLIESYLSGQLSTGEFHDRYLAEFKSMPGGVSEETYDLLNDLFYAVEAYHPDPDLRDEFDVGEAELRTAARETKLRVDERLRHLTE